MVWLGLGCLNATFNNISVISWRSVLLVEETGVPVENHRSGESHRQTLSHFNANLIKKNICICIYFCVLYPGRLNK